MSMLMRTVLEAEATSAREAMRAAMREEDLRPSLRAALQELVRARQPPCRSGRGRSCRWWQQQLSGQA